MLCDAEGNTLLHLAVARRMLTPGLKSAVQNTPDSAAATAANVRGDTALHLSCYADYFEAGGAIDVWLLESLMWCSFFSSH